MYNYQDTVSYTTSSIFFVVLIILGAFTTLNLVLASIMDSYLKQEAKEEKERAKARAEKEKQAKLLELTISNER